MGLDVIWRNETGEQLGAFYDTEEAFVRAVLDAREREYPTLGRIDEYRTSQIPANQSVSDEVSRLRDHIFDPAVREQLSRVLALIRRAASQPGSYLEFVGD